jgi:type I restriction enzyme R subunit
VVVITDRVVLDRQLQATIFQFDHKAGVVERIDKHSQQLGEALMSAKAQIIVTTLQKFPFVLDQVSGLEKDRYAVIVDEAHSSQTGETAKALKTVLGAGAPDETRELAEAEAEAQKEETEADPEELLLRAVETRGRQPNLSFFAFTATPKQRTLELFGQRNAEGKYEPYHVYSMRQAIEERFILDVLKNYVTYRTYWRLAMTAAEDPQLDKAKAARALAKIASEHPEQFAQKAQIIVEHFRRVTRHKIGGKAKAMVVTRSRLHTVRMKQAIDRFVEEQGYTDVGPLVAFSGTVVDGGVDYTEAQMNGFSEAQLPRRFASNDFRLLVVAEKYQTGYDQPLLHTMYVDKKLEGVKVVQTLSRLNRIHPDKDDTFVLDFTNDAEDIQASFKPFFETTIAQETDPNLVYNAQDALEQYAVIDEADVEAFVAALLQAGPAKDIHPALYQHLDPAVERFKGLDDDDRAEFSSALERFVRLYAFLAQVVPYGDIELERLYMYGRFLALRLPREEERGLDLSDDVVLTHLRTQLQAEQDISLSEGEGELPGFRGDATGPEHEAEKVKLSDLVDQLNERFGTSFAKADQLYFDQLEESMAEDEELAKQAQANTLENFKFGFAEFEEKVIDRRESNEELFTRILEDEQFSGAVREYLLERVYERLRKAA